MSKKPTAEDLVAELDACSPYGLRDGQGHDPEDCIEIL